MPNLGMFPNAQVLLALATQTTSGTSAAITLPPAQSYRIIVQCNTVSGTTPTLVLALATSFDNGTTYTSVLSSTTATTSGQSPQILFRPYMAGGDVATSQMGTLVGTGGDIAAAVVNNGPVNPQFIKLRWVVSGTTPSFAFQVGLIAMPQGGSDD